jgi:hypothetical protein
MKPETPEFERLITRLDDIIEDVAATDFQETAALLRMAQIDLLTRVYNISPEELDALLSVIRCGPGYVGTSLRQTKENRTGTSFLPA